MALAIPISLKSGSLLVGVLGAAAGLNLSVMGIADRAESDPAVALAPAAEGEVVQVVVDVPVPERAADVQVAPPAAQAVAPAAPASPSPVAVAPPAAPAPVPAAPVPTTAAPAPTTAAPAPTTTPATAAPTTPGSTPATTVAASTEYLFYTFDGIAEIVIAYHDGESLEFWSASTEDGWAYMVEKNSAKKVEIKFRRVSGGEGEAKFEVIREDGELEVKKER